MFNISTIGFSLSLFIIISLEWFWRLSSAFYHIGVPVHLFLFCVKILVVTLFFISIYNNRYRISPFSLFYFAIILVMTIYIVVFYDVYGFDRNGKYLSAFEYNWNVIFSSLVFIGVGYFFRFKDDHVRPLIYIYVCFVFFVLIHSDLAHLSLAHSRFINKNFSNYTYLADVFSILSIVVLSYFYDNKRYKYFLLSFFSSVFILILLNSRSSLIFFLMAIVTFYFVSRSVKTSIKVSVLFLLLLVFFFKDHVILFLVENFDVSPRLRNLIEMNFDDRSFNSRELFAQAGYKAIQDSPFIGDFAGQLNGPGDREGVRWGAYIHNIMSYWRQFGIIGFTLVVLSLASVIIFYKREAARGKADNFILVLWLFFVFSMIFSRSYMNYYFFMVFGYCILRGEICSER